MGQGQPKAEVNARDPEVQPHDKGGLAHAYRIQARSAQLCAAHRHITTATITTTTSTATSITHNRQPTAYSPQPTAHNHTTIALPPPSSPHTAHFPEVRPVEATARERTGGAKARREQTAKSNVPWVPSTTSLASRPLSMTGFKKKK